MTRLYISIALAATSEIEANPEQSHYLAHVMRVGMGDEVLLFNGVDGEWRAKITAVKKHAVRLEIETQTRAQTAEQSLQLLFAPIKRGHGDMVVEKATELGVTRLSPVITQHTVVSRVPVERYEAIACEAAEQCERLSLPTIDAPQKLADVLQNWDDTPLLFCAEAGDATPIAEALNAIKPGKLALLTGPEGGFSKDEFALLREKKFIVPVHLGPRILRADTAAIAALSIVQALAGDWRQR